jgi:hypothetical protein
MVRGAGRREQGGRRSTATGRRQARDLRAQRAWPFWKKRVNAVIYSVELDAVICGAELDAMICGAEAIFYGHVPSHAGATWIQAWKLDTVIHGVETCNLDAIHHGVDLLGPILHLSFLGIQKRNFFKKRAKL